MEREVRFAVLYLRLSKDHVHSEGSLRSQESALRERAAALRLPVRAVVSEGAGRSAYGTKGVDRPAWDELVRSTHPGDVVMAVEMSRFARDVEDGLRQLRRIRDAGGDVVTLDGEDTRDTSSNLALTVRLAVAEEESRLKGDRSRRLKRRLQNAGRWPGGPPPFGYRLGDGRLVLDPETAPVVRRIFAEVLAGRSVLATCGA